MDARPVREPRIDDRLRDVDPPTERPDQPLAQDKAALGLAEA